jgi:hypothetical protein
MVGAAKPASGMKQAVTRVIDVTSAVKRIKINGYFYSDSALASLIVKP